MRIFILEDDPFRIDCFIDAFQGHELTIAEDIDQAKHKFVPSSYALILLDHDLGGEVYVSSSEENTGYQFCKWVKEKLDPNDFVVVHSWNPDGAINMMQELKGCKAKIYRQYFGSDLLKRLQKAIIERKWRGQISENA